MSILNIDDLANAHHMTMTSNHPPQPSIQTSQPSHNDKESDVVDFYSESHDTLGLHWDDEPKRGGVSSKAGVISEITTPELFPLNQIKIQNSGMAQIVIGGTNNEMAATDVHVDHLDSDTLTFDDRINGAKEKLDAGMKASDAAAFDTAATYFSMGRTLLGENGWDIDRATMLKLCSEEAHASYMNTDFNTMTDLIDEVLSKDIPVKDKFRVYEVKLLYDHSQGNYDEALKVGLDVRRQLGFPIIRNKPVSTLKVLIRFIKTNRALGNRSAEELAGLPELTDERVIMGQRMLELLLTSCYQVQPTLFPILICTLTDTSLKHGINASASDGFTTFGILLSGAFGNPKRGKEMGKAAELIFAKHTRMKSRSTYGCQGFIYHWNSPLRETLTPLFDGYVAGLEIGDTESSALCLGFHVAHTFYAGLPLETDSVALMINLHIQSHHPNIHSELFLQVYLLAIKKLRNMELEENEKDFEDIQLLLIEDNNLPLYGYVKTVKLELKVFFGQWVEARDLLLETGDIRASLLGLFAGVRFTFIESLISLKAAQSSSGSTRRKWTRRALKSMKLIDRWKKKGNVNIIQCKHILDAELSVLRRKNEKAEESFQLAIAIASKNGFLQDQALSHELFGAYFRYQGNNERRNYHMEQAITYYRKWGATAKVEQLTMVE